MTDATMPSGISASDFDPQIRPQDDLYRHVNGRWLASHEIPADRAVDGAFRALHDQAERDVRAIIEDLGASIASSDSTAGARPAQTAESLVAQQIGGLYASFLDEERADALGYQPLEQDLASINAAPDRAALITTLGHLQRTGGPSLVGWWVDNDALDPQKYVVYLRQAGLGLPDEAYYRDPQHADTLAAYRAHLVNVISDADLAADPEIAATQLAALETKIASHHWDAVRDREAELTYNPTPLDDLVAAAPGLDWRSWVAATGIPEAAYPDLIVREPSFAMGLANLWASESLDDWKLWARFHLVRKFSPYLHTAAAAENFDFYGRALTGTEQMRERWKRGVSLVEGALGEAVGRVYVQRHFPPGHKAHMDTLVANLVAAYRASITDLDWMTAETRERALAKLDSFTPKIGYPTSWRDYSSLVIDATDLVGNVRRSNEFDHAWECAKIGKPIDRDEWFMTPQTVNAYYNPGMNEIVFPAAILQPPFFDPTADDAANYGGIGAVIGHEIGHGFDDQGSKYDGTGQLADWWTAADRAEFEQRTAALIAQYDAFVPVQLAPDGPHVNGALTIGENIGDLGGLSIAIQAYEISLQSKGQTWADAPAIDGYTALQRIFLGWAQVWQTKIRDEALIQRIAVDPHSPAEFRCNGIVRNLPQFYEAFGVAPADELYLDPAERVRIW